MSRALFSLALLAGCQPAHVDEDDDEWFPSHEADADTDSDTDADTDADADADADADSDTDADTDADADVDDPPDTGAIKPGEYDGTLEMELMSDVFGESGYCGGYVSLVVSSSGEVSGEAICEFSTPFLEESHLTMELAGWTGEADIEGELFIQLGDDGMDGGWYGWSVGADQIMGESEGWDVATLGPKKGEVFWYGTWRGGLD